jgi:hypothetical protein
VLAALDTALPGAVPEAVCAAGTAQRARMSQAARFSVSGAGGRSAIFAKWPSQHLAVRRLGRLTGAYQREVMFYRELAGACPIRLPRPYFCGYEPGTGDFVLLLEDIATARPGDSLESSAAEVERALVTAARLHASWMDDGRLSQVSWLPAPGGPQVRRYMRFELDRIRRAAAPGRPAAGAMAALAPLLARLDGELDQFFQDGASRQQTLVHGDLHADQVLFPEPGGPEPGGPGPGSPGPGRTGPGDPVLVDWQMAQRENVGIDTARLIVLSLSVPDRRAHEDRLLDAYRDALAAGGAPAYSRGDCRSDYRRGITRTAFVNAAFRLTAAGGTEAGGFHEVMNARIAAAAGDHGLLRDPA